jgi:hypothetical protein
MNNLNTPIFATVADMFDLIERLLGNEEGK